jgi:hypothetical protein
MSRLKLITPAFHVSPLTLLECVKAPLSGLTRFVVGTILLYLRRWRLMAMLELS